VGEDDSFDSGALFQIQAVRAEKEGTRSGDTVTCARSHIYHSPQRRRSSPDNMSTKNHAPAKCLHRHQRELGHLRPLALPWPLGLSGLALHPLHRIPSPVASRFRIVTLREPLLPSKPKLLILFLSLPVRTSASPTRLPSCPFCFGSVPSILQCNLEQVLLIRLEVCPLSFCIVLATAS
jgi:hypothetical protein